MESYGIFYWFNLILQLSELKINEKFDNLTKEQNIELYKILQEKCNKKIYSKLPVYNTLKSVLEEGIEKFKEMSIERQIKLLAEIVKYFKTGRKDACDLSALGGAKKTGTILINSKITGSKFSCIEIIDQSPTGLFEKKSGNLLEL